MTSGRPNHRIEVISVPSQCGTQGHIDLVVTCSCGMEQKLNHGSRSVAAETILYHRISAIEAALGLKININWKT